MSGPSQGRGGFPIDPKQVRPKLASRVYSDRWLRWSVVALTSIALGLYAASFFQEWWQFWLFAPQYPNGLRLDIKLTGLGGDAREIDMLNHYIGMGHLDEAAPIERSLGGYGVGLVGLLTLSVTLLAGKRGHWLVVVSGLALPAGFVIDSFLWLWWFGHHLDRHAPLNIPAFTPELFGEGAIGQFHTFARPQLGFGLACAAFGTLALAAFLRHKVCKDCELAPTCGKVCPEHFIGTKHRDAFHAGKD